MTEPIFKYISNSYQHGNIQVEPWPVVIETSNYIEHKGGPYQPGYCTYSWYSLFNNRIETISAIFNGKPEDHQTELNEHRKEVCRFFALLHKEVSKSWWNRIKSWFKRC